MHKPHRSEKAVAQESVVSLHPHTWNFPSPLPHHSYLIVAALLLLLIHLMYVPKMSSQPFIQFHLEIDGNLSLLEAHTISDKIAAELMKHFPKAEIIIHQDPV